MKKKVALLLVLLAAALGLPGLTVHGEELEVSAPAAVLMEAGTGRVLFERSRESSAWRTSCPPRPTRPPWAARTSG